MSKRTSECTSSGERMSAFRGFVYLFNCSTAVSRLFQDSTELFQLMRNSFCGCWGRSGQISLIFQAAFSGNYRKSEIRKAMDNLDRPMVSFPCCFSDVKEIILRRNVHFNCKAPSSGCLHTFLIFECQGNLDAVHTPEGKVI